TTFGPTNPVPPVTRITPSILRPGCYRFQARYCGDEKVVDRAVYGRRAGGCGGGVLGGRPRAHCLPRRRASIGLDHDLHGHQLDRRRESSSLRRVAVAMRNSGSKPHSAVLYGSCATIVRPAGSAPGRLQVKVLTRTTAVQPGSHTIKRSCPAGWVSLATGYTL